MSTQCLEDCPRAHIQNIAYRCMFLAVFQAQEVKLFPRSVPLQNFPGLSNPCQTSTSLVLRKVWSTWNINMWSCQVQAVVQTADHKFFLLVEMLTYRTRWQRQHKVCALVNSNDLNRNIRVMYYRVEDDYSVSLLSWKKYRACQKFVISSVQHKTYQKKLGKLRMDKTKLKWT
jgi:hypothetical protein